MNLKLILFCFIIFLSNILTIEAKETTTVPKHMNAWATPTPTPTPPQKEAIIKAIKEFAKKGEICKIYAHQWVSGCGTPYCAVYHSQQIRYCSMCNQTEYLTPPRWKSK